MTEKVINIDHRRFEKQYGNMLKQLSIDLREIIENQDAESLEHLTYILSRQLQNAWGLMPKEKRDQCTIGIYKHT